VVLACTAAVPAADPFTTQWVTVPDLALWKPAPGAFGAANMRSHGLLSDGRALCTAPPAAAASSNDISILIFDPMTNAWSWRAPFPSNVRTSFYVDGPYLFPFGDRKSLVMTRLSTSTTTWKSWVYDDSAAGSFTAVPDVVTTSAFGSPYAALLANGNLLIVSSSKNGPSYIFNPTSASWTPGLTGPSVEGIKVPSSVMGRMAPSMPNGDFFLWGTNSSNLQTTGFSVRLNGSASAWNSALITIDNSILSTSSPLVGERFYTSLQGSGIIHAFSTIDDTFTQIPGSYTSFPSTFDCYFMRLRSLGRDWFAAINSPGRSDANYGKFSGSVFDRSSATWFALPTTDKILYNTSGGRSSDVVQLGNGAVLTGLTSDTGTLRTRRLMVTSGTAPVAPQIANDIATISLVEGSFTSLRYHVDGDLPPGGVTVIAERAAGGSGNLVVIQGASQAVVSNADYKTAVIAALPDANAVADMATLRLRIAGASSDPNARSVPVTISEASVQPPSLAGDVNGDGTVNAADLQAVVETFGQSR
jgi:hypothetical protein